eukprot:1774895-Amphidinium_carterae.1
MSIKVSFISRKHVPDNQYKVSIWRRIASKRVETSCGTCQSDDGVAQKGETSLGPRGGTLGGKSTG